MHTRSSTRTSSRKEVEIVTISDDEYEDTIEIDDSSDVQIIATDCSPNSDHSIQAHETTPSTEDWTMPCNTAPDADEMIATEDCCIEDYEYNLKLIRRPQGTIERYETTSQTKLKVALKDLINEVAKSGNSLQIRRKISPDNEEIVSLEETPESLNLNSGSILYALVLYAQQQQHPTISASTTNNTKPKRDPNIISLKLQDGQRKHLKEFEIGKQEPLRILKEKYAKEFDIDIERMRLSFDGDTVEDDDTPAGLDIEDECVIDVIVCAPKV